MRNRRRAFTLVELLIVIGIVVLLVSILLPSLARVRELSRRTACLSNLRQIGLVLTSYAHAYDGRLPTEPGGGQWLWDLPISTRDDLVKLGATRDMFYCPSAADLDLSPRWDPNPPIGYTMLGYFILNQRTPPAPFSAPVWPKAPTIVANSNWNYCSSLLELPFLPPPKQATRVPTTLTTTPLATDAQLSVNGNFYNVGSAYGAVPAHTSHLKGTSYPFGGNILFLDGHGEWRTFDPSGGPYLPEDMQPRATAPATNGTVTFWF